MMISSEKKAAWAALLEDYDEFRHSHRQEAKSRLHYVPARMISLPGLVLYELEKRKFIESDGIGGYRPLR